MAPAPTDVSATSTPSTSPNARVGPVAPVDRRGVVDGGHRVALQQRIGGDASALTTSANARTLRMMAASTWASGSAR